MQEKESVMGHRIKIGIFNPRDDQAGWYLGGALVRVLVNSSVCQLVLYQLVPKFHFFFFFFLKSTCTVNL